MARPKLVANIADCKEASAKQERLILTFESTVKEQLYQINDLSEQLEKSEKQRTLVKRVAIGLFVAVIVEGVIIVL
jgi:septal ring factor EnvC (AmiA/AmiB activator)